MGRRHVVDYRPRAYALGDLIICLVPWVIPPISQIRAEYSMWLRVNILNPSLLVWLLVGILYAGMCHFPVALADEVGTALGPPVETITLPVTRDTWVSSVNGEQDANLGGASRLKLKGIQEFSLLDIAPPTRKLKGRVIVAAMLHMRNRSPDPLRRVTVSSLSSPWVEGTATTYRSKIGCSSFNWARQDQIPWAGSGSDITAVINGEGNSLWGFADASPPNAKGWQTVAVRPAVVAARVAGLSHGFVLFDDVGSEYERHGQHFVYRMFPNRYVASRQAEHGSRPYMTVYLGPHDDQPPQAIKVIQQVSPDEPLPSGQAIVQWNSPPDAGPAGTMGFLVKWTRLQTLDWDQAHEVPRYLIPLAGHSSTSVTMHLRDLDGLNSPTREVGSDSAAMPGSWITLGIRPIDATGNVGPVTTCRVQLSRPPQRQEPLDSFATSIPPFEDPGPLPRIGAVSVFVVDPLDKVAPDSGRLIPSRPDAQAYRRANHLWSSQQRLIRLYAARNEHVGFQLVLNGEFKHVRADLSFDRPRSEQGRKQAQRQSQLEANPRIEWFEYRDVPTPSGLLPDPLVPTHGLVTSSQPSVSPDTPDTPVAKNTANRRYTRLLGEIYVPRGTSLTSHQGTLRLTTEAGSIELRVDLHVWGFTLPDFLSFIPQMNCYGLPGPPYELAYYRLAQVHRTCLNRLPYNWRGQIRGGHAPDLRKKKSSHASRKSRDNAWDWSRYDRRFGPLLDGSAFADLPRGSVPVEAFYLPINENWPMNIERSFNGSYWSDEAFTSDYRDQLVDASRRFAQHCKERQWTDTFFEFYLNNKVFFKRPGWGRCSAPWIFDEPVNTQDFWALRWYGAAFHEGVGQTQAVKEGVKMVFRCDISRPQWQRDLLDDLLDVNVVSGAFRTYRHRVIDRKIQWGEIVYEYGGSNRITDSNTWPAAWCIDAWSLGADGVLPWQTVGNDTSWQRGDAQSLFYPGRNVGLDEPVPSIRLKAYRRGQQDVEYLTILSQLLGLPRWLIAQSVRRQLGLEATYEKNTEIDAGGLAYGQLTPDRLWRLRMWTGKILDERQPPERRRWVKLTTPKREPNRIPTLGHFE